MFMVVAKYGATLEQIDKWHLPPLAQISHIMTVILLAGTNDIDGLSPRHKTVLH